MVALLKLARFRAVDIADAITETLTNLGLSLDSLRGQGYDGASTMSVSGDFFYKNGQILNLIDVISD